MLGQALLLDGWLQADAGCASTLITPHNIFHKCTVEIISSFNKPLLEKGYFMIQLL